MTTVCHVFINFNDIIARQNMTNLNNLDKFN